MLWVYCSLDILTPTFARTLVKDQPPKMKLHHDGMPELEHEVIAKNDPVVVKLDNGQNFGSGTSLGYGFDF
ncbi:hypothetical protein Bca4012_063769 [Brassica carinata]|uniref:Uncharacterized protein n=1 Tax=Brassica carinata TaxID=52824 RepID=A0A8X7V9C7_BRACI|nr:hypothetical protein Bca52824_033367 [Brassica carinata]